VASVALLYTLGLSGLSLATVMFTSSSCSTLRLSLVHLCHHDAKNCDFTEKNFLMNSDFGLQSLSYFKAIAAEDISLCAFDVCDSTVNCLVKQGLHLL